MAKVIAEIAGRIATLLGYDGTDFRNVRVDGSGHLQVDVVSWATTPALYNVAMTLANTEYSQALPANTRKLLIRCRGAYAIKVAYVSTESGTKYLTVPSGMTYWEDLIQPATLTLYFQCATAAQEAEIVAWS